VSAPGPRRFVVRLRWERGAYTSPAMPQHEAEQQAEDLHQDVLDCGDGIGFVTFTGWDGRTIRVRGREVIGIECSPHREGADGHSPTGADKTFFPDRAAAASGEDVGGGTAFLRQVAGIRS
jgi:hypothetical protein